MSVCMCVQHTGKMQVAHFNVHRQSPQHSQTFTSTFTDLRLNVHRQSPQHSQGKMQAAHLNVHKFTNWASQIVFDLFKLLSVARLPIHGLKKLTLGVKQGKILIVGILSCNRRCTYDHAPNVSICTWILHIFWLTAWIMQKWFVVRLQVPFGAAWNRILQPSRECILKSSPGRKFLAQQVCHPAQTSSKSLQFRRRTSISSRFEQKIRKTWRRTSVPSNLEQMIRKT